MIKTQHPEPEWEEAFSKISYLQLLHYNDDCSEPKHHLLDNLCLGEFPLRIKMSFMLEIATKSNAYHLANILVRNYKVKPTLEFAKLLLRSQEGSYLVKLIKHEKFILPSAASSEMLDLMHNGSASVPFLQYLFKQKHPWTKNSYLFNFSLYSGQLDAVNFLLEKSSITITIDHLIAAIQSGSLSIVTRLIRENPTITSNSRALAGKMIGAGTHQNSFSILNNILNENREQDEHREGTEEFLCTVIARHGELINLKELYNNSVNSAADSFRQGLTHALRTAVCTEKVDMVKYLILERHIPIVNETLTLGFHSSSKELFPFLLSEHKKIKPNFVWTISDSNQITKKNFGMVCQLESKPEILISSDNSNSPISDKHLRKWAIIFDKVEYLKKNTSTPNIDEFKSAIAHNSVNVIKEFYHLSLESSRPQFHPKEVKILFSKACEKGSLWIIKKLVDHKDFRKTFCNINNNDFFNVIRSENLLLMEFLLESGKCKVKPGFKIPRDSKFDEEFNSYLLNKAKSSGLGFCRIS